jgi:molecular chaperone DnaK (HSP70)
MVDESFQYAEADVETRMLIEVCNEADTVMTHVRRALKQGGHLATPTDVARVADALQALERARETADRDLIRARTGELNRVTEGLAQALMDAALRTALGTRRAAEILGTD